jgi:hypothetical protein
MRECAPDDRLRSVSNHDPLSVMAGLRPGHPRLSCSIEAKTWMPGTRPGMTNSASERRFIGGFSQVDVTWPSLDLPHGIIPQAFRHA